MREVAYRLLLIFVVASSIAYGTYLVLGSAIQADTDVALKRVVARDVVSDGTHHLNGMVFVPTGCHELSTRLQKLDDTTHVIVFTTWEAPYAECVREPVPRAFNTVIFTSSPSTQFLATVDDEIVPFVVIPVAGR